MSVEFCRESPGNFDSRTLSRKTLSRWTGRIVVSMSISIAITFTITITVINMNELVIVMRCFIIINIITIIIIIIISSSSSSSALQDVLLGLDRHAAAGHATLVVLMLRVAETA